ncbi:FecR domain-containing protein [Paucibacter sp. PLA-PC-4]|uniref:FecR family protein n=1 Tax=Paucibacter sp. PLA-PC-4 TaxID=2993655 RepID=UPI00224ADEEC|nr:FecR domain-containing protein [Paucibacter sp. PLA-PC-4]MCX2864909.1 FecR domain-containing protein [Paucibacter sp. PLA-PC-4]
MAGDGMNGRDGLPGRDSGPTPVVTRKIAAEAATWIARLHGPGRSPEMERALREWLSRSAAHRHAFEKCTDVWQEVAGVSAADVYAGAAARSLNAALAGERWWARMRWPLLGLLALVIAVAAFAAHRWWAVEVYATKVGEQQLVLLEDGSRLSLNTDTQVRVELNAERRSVRVEGGEVVFEVAKDAYRPFVVRAADSEVLAIGTIFAVRLPGRSTDRRDEPLTVTLIEGQIGVRPVSGDAGQRDASKARLMKPGERLVLATRRSQPSAQTVPAIEHLQRPQLEQLLAWKRGEVVFDNISLPQAVSEMNRYTRTPMVLIGDASTLRVSGLYQTSDSPGFARAVAALHGLELRERAGRLELAISQ